MREGHPHPLFDREARQQRHGLHSQFGLAQESLGPANSTHVDFVQYRVTQLLSKVALERSTTRRQLLSHLFDRQRWMAVRPNLLQPVAHLGIANAFTVRRTLQAGEAVSIRNFLPHRSDQCQRLQRK